MSGCTFSESHTWGKYEDPKKGLVQVWGEMSIVAPLIFWYVVENCKPRALKRIVDLRKKYYAELVEEYKKTSFKY